MRKLSKILGAVLLTILLVFLLGSPVRAIDDSALVELNKKIAEYEQEIEKLQSQANTLSNQIAQFNAQIQLTQLKIDQTKEKILLLGGRIDQLEGSLSSLTAAFSSRVIETYKMSRLGDTLLFLFSSGDLNQVVSRYRYLQKIQEADRELMVRLQRAQDVYQEERTGQEELHAELEEQEKVLGVQKTAKNQLLAATKNDERKYQQLLAQARAELEAIQAIIAGKGQETESGHVGEGQRIASIIQGASCNSSGAHVHFMVSEGGTTHNPFDYLSSGVSYLNCSGPGECSEGDPFNPHGNWSWPISPTIRFTQGYGYTWAIQNTWVGQIYNFHNGIDINSESSSEVRAVKNGTLFRGAYSGQSGCVLRYVRVDHDDSNVDTYYLHVNY